MPSYNELKITVQLGAVMQNNRRPINPWLLTWSCLGPFAETSVRNKIAAILHGRSSLKQVKQTMCLLLANFDAQIASPESIFVSAQVQHAKREYSSKILDQHFNEYVGGWNPYLIARQVYNLKMEGEENKENLRWEENVYPTIVPGKSAYEQLKTSMPFKRKRMMFNSTTNQITEVEPAVTGL